MPAKNPDTSITEIELVYYNKKKVADQPNITSSFDAYDLFRRSWNEGQLNLREHFKVMLLSRANKCIGISSIAEGGVSGGYIDTKLAFALAIKAKASGMVLAHNHPSGNSSFSDSDMRLTRVFVELAKLLGISILDHIVITDTGYNSMSDNGCLPLERSNGDFGFFLEKPQPMEKPMKEENTTPLLCIFNKNSFGEKPVGAVFAHKSGKGCNVVLAGERYVAFPPKPKPEQQSIPFDNSNTPVAEPKQESQPKKKPTKARSLGKPAPKPK